MDSSRSLFGLNQSCIEEALARLSPVGQYCTLMKMLPEVNVYEDKQGFRPLFEEFYKLKRYPHEFRDEYFKFMQENKKKSSLPFEDILEHLKGINGRIEASFASKLLHTINPKYPAWDKWVGENTGIKIPVSQTDKFIRAVKQYDKLIEWFNDYIHSEEGKAALRLFDQYYPAFCLSDTKKIELVLWQCRKEKEE